MKRGLILNAVVREMRTGILVLDRSGDVIFANPFFLESFPSEDGVIGRPIESIVKNNDLLAAVKGFLTTGRAAGEFEMNEAARFFSVRMVPAEEDGERSLLLFLREITEEKRVETIKRDFVSNVSHELRTPLASIKGYAETLLDAGTPADRRKEFLKVIDRHASRMSRIIDDLLILSRLESEQFSMVLMPVDLRELLSSTLKGFEKQAGDRDITISADLPGELPQLLGDRDRLEQVVVNLLDNAIKYTQPGGRIFIKAAAGKGAVRVDVIDTGIGIPEEDIPRIFERFYRVDKARSRAQGGTGLGLAIVKHIIQGHGGHLHVESIRGKGSTFRFSIPSAP